MSSKNSPKNKNEGHSKINSPPSAKQINNLQNNKSSSSNEQNKEVPKEPDLLNTERDILISTLQNELKQIENTYKQNLDESQKIRDQYCNAVEKLSRLEDMYQKLSEEKEKLSEEGKKLKDQQKIDQQTIKELKEDVDKWKKQYEEASAKSPQINEDSKNEKCTKIIEDLIVNQIKLLKDLNDKVNIIMVPKLQKNLDNACEYETEEPSISSLLHQVKNPPVIIPVDSKEEIYRLRDIEIKILKDENLLLTQQIEHLKEQIDSNRRLPAVKDSVINILKKENIEYKEKVTRMQSLLGEISTDDTEDELDGRKNTVSFTRPLITSIDAPRDVDNASLGSNKKPNQATDTTSKNSQPPKITTISKSYSFHSNRTLEDGESSSSGRSQCPNKNEDKPNSTKKAPLGINAKPMNKEQDGEKLPSDLLLEKDQIINELIKQNSVLATKFKEASDRNEANIAKIKELEATLKSCNCLAKTSRALMPIENKMTNDEQITVKHLFREMDVLRTQIVVLEKNKFQNANTILDSIKFKETDSQEKDILIEKLNKCLEQSNKTLKECEEELYNLNRQIEILASANQELREENFALKEKLLFLSPSSSNNGSDNISACVGY